MKFKNFQMDLFGEIRRLFGGQFPSRAYVTAWKVKSVTNITETSLWKAQATQYVP